MSAPLIKVEGTVIRIPDGFVFDIALTVGETAPMTIHFDETVYSDEEAAQAGMKEACARIVQLAKNGLETPYIAASDLGDHD